jgi:hypothetical protein
MSTLYEEELKKINFENLHETIFTIDPNNEQENSANDDYLHANKVGHLVQEAPKIDSLSVNFYKFLNKRQVKQALQEQQEKKASTKSSISSSSVYSYEQSQRKLTDEQTTYQAVDRTIIFNKFTSNVIQAATLSTTKTTTTTTSTTTSTPLNENDKPDSLLEKIVDLTNKKIKIRLQNKKDQEENAIKESPESQEQNQDFELYEDLENNPIKTTAKFMTLKKEIEISINFHFSCIPSKYSHYRNQIVIKALEDFKHFILNYDEVMRLRKKTAARNARDQQQQQRIFKVFFHIKLYLRTFYFSYFFFQF